MVATRVRVVDESREKDGCLLLWLEGNVVFSLNECALIIWTEMERHPKGVATEQLTEYLDEYYSGCHVSKVRLRQDVRNLLDQLRARGFLECVEAKDGQSRYRIKEDVFRTAVHGVLDADDQAYDMALAYRPNEHPSLGRVRSFKDFCLAFIALIAYEIILKTRGFAQLCVTVEHWPVAKRHSWSATRVQQISAGIDRARLWYPKNVQCLQHSAVVTCLLRAQGIPARMVLAAARKPFYAHAWSEVNGTVVNDEQSVRRRYGIFTRCLSRSIPELKEVTQS